MFDWIDEKIRSCPVPGWVGHCRWSACKGRDTSWRPVSSLGHTESHWAVIHTGINGTVKCKGMVKYSGCVVILYVIPSWERQQYFLSPAFYFLAQWWEIYQAWISQHCVLPSMCINCLDELLWSSLCFFCLVLKLCLFTWLLGELRTVQWWLVYQFVILCLLLVLIKSQQFQCGTTDLKDWLFVPEICYLALLKEMTISFLPGLSGLCCSDRIWRLRFRSSSSVLLCCVLGILRCYGNCQIFSFCKVRYLT